MTQTDVCSRGRQDAAARGCRLGLLLLLLLAALHLEASEAAPSSGSVPLDLTDIDAVRELYELLSRRAALEEAALRAQLPPDALLDHTLERKAGGGNRSPSLRLRFGRSVKPQSAPRTEHDKTSSATNK